jgi:chromosome partitioning protein
MDRNASVDEVLLKTTVPGMDLIPSDIMLSGAEIGLVNEVAREQSLKRILAPLALEYDVILIDCQPSLGLLTVNALTAADLILVPLQCEYFALRGFKLLKEITSKIQERLNPDLAIIGIVATMFEKTAHSKEVLARIYEAFPSLLFDTVISKTVRFNETTAAGEPITSYASSSPGATAYRRLAREVIARGGSR